MINEYNLLSNYQTILLLFALYHPIAHKMPQYWRYNGFTEGIIVHVLLSLAMLLKDYEKMPQSICVKLLLVVCMCVFLWFLSCYSMKLAEHWTSFIKFSSIWQKKLHRWYNTINHILTWINFYYFKHLQTDSEVACEEAARLTADIQDENTPEDDDELCEYHDMPPPPDGGWVLQYIDIYLYTFEPHFFINQTLAFQTTRTEMLYSNFMIDLRMNCDTHKKKHIGKGLGIPNIVPMKKWCIYFIIRQLKMSNIRICLSA